MVEKALFRMGLEEMRVMRTLLSKRLHPWHAVEVHVVVTAMGRGDMVPKRGGRGFMIREARSEGGMDEI